MVWCMFSCTYESEQDHNLKKEHLELNEDQQLIRETALIVGEVLSNKEVKNEVLNSMIMIDEYNSLISFSYLLGDQSRLMKNEATLISANKSLKSPDNSMFKSELLKVANSNKSILPHWSKYIEKSISKLEYMNSKSSSNYAEQLIDLLILKNYQLYFPYAEVNTKITSKNDQDSYYITYDPLKDVLTNEAFEIDNSSDTLRSIGQIDDDFVDVNQVFIISPIDECDLNSSTCDYESFTEQKATLNDIVQTSTLLTHNVNHFEVKEEDVLSVVMPAFKIVGKDWLGLFAANQKIILYRASADQTPKVVNGKIDVASSGVPISGKIKIRRRDVLGDGVWQLVNLIYDDDWNMSENEQKLQIFSKHNFHVKATVNIKTKAGFNLDKGVIKVDPVVTVESNIEISEPHAENRFTIPFNRKAYLTTIVGNGITNEFQPTLVDTAMIDFNVKRYGPFKFYLNYYYTDLKN